MQTTFSQGEVLRYETPTDHYSLHLGHPENDLLPVADVRSLLAEFGTECHPLRLQYGEEAGSRSLTGC